MAKIACRLSWNDDFDLEAKFVDLPPDLAAAQMNAMGIGRDYFLFTPLEPDSEALVEARRTLNNLLGERQPSC